ncbi:MAG: NADP-dependent oxidoreductase [Gammaproteobacteria bacterium]|nr:NADP-dependent oxidoreductase [Gammaproteobacteria bacterium]
MQNLQIRVRRAAAKAGDFELIEAPLPAVTNGTFLCRTLWLALDPFLLGGTGDGAAGPVKPGDLVPARGVGEVIESRHDVFGVGSVVVLDAGLQQFAVTAGQYARFVHPGQTPASTALGILGAPGMAAYFGLLDLATLKPGETVLVSAASNAAGSMAGQIAMLKGARAIGMAGTREKCEWVTRHARLASCINYRSEPLSARLRQLAPRGVDVYFDNSGGELLETLIAGRHLASGARIIQNSLSASDPGPALERAGYLAADGIRVLRARVRDYEHRRGEFLREAISWYGAGRIARKDHVVEGLANAPALLTLAMRGDSFGRPLVKL